MSENDTNAINTPKPTSELDTLKQAHDYYATAVQLLTQRCKYFHEEFQGVSNTVGFLKQLQAQVLTAIHKIEPPAEKVKENYEMDLSHVKGEAPQVELN
jgi:hypothetical protein